MFNGSNPATILDGDASNADPLPTLTNVMSLVRNSTLAVAVE